MAASVAACLSCVQVIDTLLQRSCDGSMLAIEGKLHAGAVLCRAVLCYALLCRAAMLALLA